MVRYLKKGMSGDVIADHDDQVRQTVEEIIEDIDTRGDVALREYSVRFDRWSPDSFRLSANDIDDCHRELSDQVIEDIKFAQAQIRNFARAQRNAILDIEVETLSGVTLGHKNLPVNSVTVTCPEANIRWLRRHT